MNIAIHLLYRSFAATPYYYPFEQRSLRTEEELELVTLLEEIVC